MREDGIVLTNAHVIGANETVKVGLALGSQVQGCVLGVAQTRDVADQVLTRGRVSRVILGIRIRDVEVELAAQFDLPVDEGVIVIGVGPNTLAARSELQQGDIIVEVDGEAITDGGDLRRVLRRREPGNIVSITALRLDGRFTIQKRLAEAVGQVAIRIPRSNLRRSYGTGDAATRVSWKSGSADCSRLIGCRLPD